MMTLVTVLVALLTINFLTDLVALAIFYKKRHIMIPRLRALLRSFLGADRDAARISELEYRINECESCEEFDESECSGVGCDDCRRSS